MAEYPSQDWVSSKEILRIAGISRATLNNYIRLGLLPRPVLDQPDEAGKGPKRMGYFPASVLSRIDEIRLFKQRGYSIEQIAGRLHRQELDADLREARVPRVPGPDPSVRALSLHFEEECLPAYFLDHELKVRWVNSAAEEVIFQSGEADGLLNSNIFKLLFKWEFQGAVRNWKDLIRFHLARIKGKGGDVPPVSFFPDISKNEVEVLNELLRRVAVRHDSTSKASELCFFFHNGLTENYQVFSIEFREGVLFVFQPM